MTDREQEAELERAPCKCSPTVPILCSRCHRLKELQEARAGGEGAPSSSVTGVLMGNVAHQRKDR